MNAIFLIGNLGSDPEIRYTQTGQAVANVGLATEERWKDKDGNRQKSTTWHNLVAWGRHAEILQEYTHKGDRLAVMGRVEQQEWTVRETGEVKKKTIVTVTHIELIGARSGERADNRAAEAAPGNDLTVPDQFAGGPHGDGLPF